MRLVEFPFALSTFEHAAAEEWLVRHADCTKGDLLILYINEPCVVVGKNQSIYREVNINFWLNNPDKVVRRVSGGGTVYHDAGNLNFSIISAFEERKVNNYAIFNEPVRKVLQSIGIPAEFNGRNDMVANGKKISGNAQFTNRKHILSHGTILVDANLENLRAALKPNNFLVETKAVSSVRSSVANITSFSSEIANAQALKTLLSKSLCDDVFTINETEAAEIVQLSKEKYETYAWCFGRSPESKIVLSDFEIHIKDGLIAEIVLKGTGNKNAFQQLKGIKFLYNEIANNGGGELLQQLQQ